MRRARSMSRLTTLLWAIFCIDRASGFCFNSASLSPITWTTPAFVPRDVSRSISSGEAVTHSGWRCSGSEPSTPAPRTVAVKMIYTSANDGTRRKRRRRTRRSARTALRERAASEDDGETKEARFEIELERDAQALIDGDEGRQAFWDKTQRWRRSNKLLRAREGQLSELERDKLRYVLRDVQTVTGLPLLNGRNITPLAWFITLTIQLMPLAAVYVIFSALTADNPEPVVDATRPFWSIS